MASRSGGAEYEVEPGVVPLAFDCNGIELPVQKVKEFRSQPFTALGRGCLTCGCLIAA